MALNVSTLEFTGTVASGVDEVVRLAVTGTVTAGTFTLGFGGQTTSAIPYNATSTQVQTALAALSTIGAGNVTCSGGPLPTTPVDITFAGDLAGLNVGVISSTDTFDNVNETQSITLTGAAGGGTFTVTFDGQTTGALAYNIAAAALQSALEGLSSVGAGNVTVTGGPLTTAPFTVTFIGDLSDTNVAEMTVDDASLTGINEVQSITTTGTVTGGTFTISYGGQTTGAIAYNASAADIDTAIEAMSSIEDGSLTCAGGPLPTPVTVTFGGTHAATNMDMLTYDSAGLTSTSEIQDISITGSPTGGTFTVTVGGAGTSGNIAFDADAAAVELAIEAIAGIGAGNATCSAGPLPGTAVRVTFTGDLANSSIATMTTTDSLTGGTNPASAVTVIQEGIDHGTVAITQQTAGAAAGTLAVATTEAGAAAGTTGLTVSTAGVKGTYRGVVTGCKLIHTSNGIVYINTGTPATPTWTEWSDVD